MNAIKMLRYFNIELEKEDFNRAGDELIALCPFHKEKNPSFFLNVDKGVFICFGCDEIGNIGKIKQKGEKFHRILVKTVLGNKMLLPGKERKFTRQEVRIGM